MGKQFYLVAYDIPDDKRRAKVHNLLSAYGEWTQYSLFEMFLSEKQRVALLHRLRQLINEKEDNVRLYPLSEDDRRRVITLGSAKPEEKIGYIF